MAENSKIEWTDHTFNPWEGCTKVSPGCDHCYAEARDQRFTGGALWGPHAPRRRTSAANWRKPLKWNAEAARTGIRRKVFCASLADVFDNHKSILPSWRADLWALIAATPHLDWLLLTKRPQNIDKMLPHAWNGGWPNVWLGTTVENQTEANRRIPHLLAAPAAVRFLSVEPMLGPVDLRFWIGSHPQIPGASTHVDRNGDERQDIGGGLVETLDWIICGGESGPGARPMHPDWARSLRDQCKAAGVAFFFKQWGEWAPGDAFGMTSDWPVSVKNGTVKDWMDRYVTTEMWGDRVRGHSFSAHSTNLVYRVGKARAGRLLDGREWNEMPRRDAVQDRG